MQDKSKILFYLFFSSVSLWKNQSSVHLVKLNSKTKQNTTANNKNTLKSYCIHWKQCPKSGLWEKECMLDL